MLLIEGEYVVMKECCIIGQLARVQVTECKGAIGIDDCLHVDFSHFLEFAPPDKAGSRELCSPHAFP